MDSNLHIFMKKHKIFSKLDEEINNQLMNKCSLIKLTYGDVLLRQGDKPSAIYLLIHGKLTVSVTTTTNPLKPLGHIDEGEMIGELAALANEPYPYTVKAIRDCIIYKLSQKDFLDLCQRYPSCILEAVQPLISRSNNILQEIPNEDRHKSTVIMPANKHVSMSIFAGKFIDILKQHTDIILFSDYLTEYDTTNDIDALRQKINHLEENKKLPQIIIYLLKSSHSPLAKIALDKAEKIYLVANALTEPLIDLMLKEYIHKNTVETTLLPDLIITHPPTTQMPRHTSAWLQLTSFNMHHHVKLDATKHFERLLRFIQGKPYGLVLGGGGTRGWGHIGTIKALCDQEYPIDFIGGTSVGAIIGACYAMRESYEDTYSKFSKIVSTSKNSISWRSVTLPIISIFDSKSFTNANREVFENIFIEDLWLPYFCVSSNLSNYSEEIHRSGLLWEKTRASSSLPGLIPPMLIDGEIHFDGGLLNNLPVDIMWQLIGKKGKVIGVELNSSMQDNHRYSFPPILAFKQAITTKMGMNKDDYKFPRFVDIFMRGLLVGSSAKAKQNGQSATILVNLSLRKFRLLKYSHKQAQKMIEIGFVETISKLHQYQNRNF